MAEETAKAEVVEEETIANADSNSEENKDNNEESAEADASVNK